ncbi:MAG: hypothetical protein GX076_05305 [Clostridiales bacterium]|nr:hypothetical protein [Clostridiales bacterium]
MDSIYNIKIELLKKCLEISEEILSNAENWEKLDELLDKRLGVIQELHDLNDEEEKYTEAQISQIDTLIRLITQIDQDVIKVLEEERKKVIESLKSNTREQKIADYGKV